MGGRSVCFRDDASGPQQLQFKHGHVLTELGSARRLGSRHVSIAGTMGGAGLE